MLPYAENLTNVNYLQLHKELAVSRKVWSWWQAVKDNGLLSHHDMTATFSWCSCPTSTVDNLWTVLVKSLQAAAVMIITNSIPLSLLH